MNQTLEPDFDELGARLGRALHSRVDSQGVRPMGIDPVLAGVGRRRARRRSGVIVVCIALIAAAGFALTSRADESVVGGDGVAPSRPAMLPAYAVLDGAPGIGEPVSMYALRGGSTMGIAIPAIDVWTSGEQRLVIRTVDNSETPISSAVTTTAVATTVAATGNAEPWLGRSVTPITARGVDGAIEDLGADQFAVWIPTSSPDRYSLVIARGMSHEEALSDVEALVEADGVLQPSTGFAATERAPAQPASTVQSPYASVVYSALTGPYVSTYSPPAGRSSIETIGWTGIGRLESVNGRDVMFDDNPYDGSSSATWIDPTGVVTSISTRDGDVEELVPFVHTVNEADWLRQSTALSGRIAGEMPAADHVTLGSVALTRRAKGGQSALCATLDAIEACVTDSSGEKPASLADQADIDGHWVIFGYREVLPEEASYLTADDLRFTSPNGSCCDVEATEHDGAIWYVVHVDDDVDVVDTNVGNIFGGVVGSITRPLVASRI